MGLFERGLFGEPDWLPTEGSLFAALFSTDNDQVTSSTLEQTFTANAGDTLRFDYFFDYGDEDPFYDFAMAELVGPSQSQTLFEFNQGSGSFLGDYANVGWSPFSLVFGETGSYTLRFTISDYDGSFESILGVDSAHIQPVPAPGAAVLAVVGLASARIIRRRIA